MEAAGERSSENGEVAEKKAGPSIKEGSIHGFESLHSLLEASLSPQLFQVSLAGSLFLYRFDGLDFDL